MDSEIVVFGTLGDLRDLETFSYLNTWEKRPAMLELVFLASARNF